MKLTKENIKEIKELNNNGMMKKDIAEKFNVSVQTIMYYTNEGFREKKIKRAMEEFMKLPKKKRSEIYRKRNDYMNRYMKKRYQQDPIFREKIKTNARTYYKRKHDTKN